MTSLRPTSYVLSPMSCAFPHITGITRPTTIPPKVPRSLSIRIPPETLWATLFTTAPSRRSAQENALTPTLNSASQMVPALLLVGP